MIESSYSELENDKKRRISEIMNSIKKLKDVNNNDIENSLKNTIDIFDAIICSEKPDRKMLELILDKISIYNDKNICFKLLVDIDKLTYNN